MHWFGVLLFVGLIFVAISLCEDAPRPKIAIVGAGIGGASASHFLTELLDGNLEIDIFEADQIGGRLATVRVNDEEYEAGGSIIHSRNKYMKAFLELLGMEERPTSKGMRAGVWNGGEFVIMESNWKIVTMMKLLYRYGLQPFKLYRHVNTILDSFENIYRYQDEGVAYDNVHDLISAMSPEFPKLLQISTAEYLHSLGFSKEIINELVEATLVVNYGQNTDVHSFVGCVSVAGAGADLWSVKGGNKEVPIHLIYRNSKVNLVPSQVKEIRYLLNNDSLPQYEISYNNAGSNNVMKNIYDIVVIATPLTEDQKYEIKFMDFQKIESLQLPGNYQTTVATFIQGDLIPSHFGLDDPIDAILSCDPNKTEINSVGKLFPVNGPIGKDSQVWKVFSKHRLTSRQISSMFSNVGQLREIPWKAYPKYSTAPRLDNFQLHDSLYHVNAIEWAASAMEMSAIGGKNVALLIHKKLTSCCRESSEIDKQKCKYSCEEKTVRRNTQKSDL
ncbi:prenylcysteine oxidase-like isoform X1 [Neodiprion virginianus]|uniref:prenylcysteine oxidase-like isoform X1 n=3 Tax=Neodiprion virginianus TaxID=2961670 RepID=UPI001EE73A6F|nr:prenylcysteine oxidase-like isoform X1 [Neodiprion virginianus]